MVEIIPKSPQASPLLTRALLFAAIGVVAAALGGFLLLFFLESRTQGKIQEAEAALREEKTAEQKQLERDVFLARSRLQDFSTIISQRKDAAPAFSFLEDVAHPQVTLLALTAELIRDTIQLKGEATSFLALDEQLAILQAREEPVNVSLTTLQLGNQGSVNFQMEIQFPATFFK